MEEEDDLQLVLSSSDEDTDDSDRFDGIQINNIIDSDSSMGIVDAVAIIKSDVTDEMFDHEFNEDFGKQSKPLDDVGQMEDGRWFSVKKCEVPIRSLSLQEKGDISATTDVENQVHGFEVEARDYAQPREGSKPGLVKQVITRTLQPGVSGDKEQLRAGYQQTGTVLGTEGLTNSVLATALNDRVGQVRLNRSRRGKKRKLRDLDDRGASEYECNDDQSSFDKVVQIELPCDDESRKILELVVYFIKVSSDGEACDDARSDDYPIDIEDKIEVDPLSSLVKPCCVRLRNIGFDSNETRIDCIEIKNDRNENMINRKEIRSHGKGIRRERKKTRSKHST